MTSLGRRGFISASSAVAGGAILNALDAPAVAAKSADKNPRSNKPVLMKLGTQEPTSAENLARFQRYGVKNICGWYKIDRDGRLYPTVDELKSLTALAETYDIRVDLTDSDIGRGDKSAIMLGKSPDRDREIEAFQMTIKNCAAAGIPAVKYYLSLLPILRSGLAPGRGDTNYVRWSFDQANAVPDKTVFVEDASGGLTRAGRVDADMMWERIDYFLERVVPVANEYKVRLAQHPHDPGMPPGGFMGIDNVLGTVEGLKRFVSLHESPYHGLNFCQGTVCEMLDDPARQIFDVIRWFGERKKIFNVHLRNIKGHRNNFVAECFPDDGDIDLPRTVEAYRDVGYDGMLMPDHIPRTIPRGRDKPLLEEANVESFVFAYGYIRALIQAAGKAKEGL
jgi:mannonate dehydratase